MALGRKSSPIYLTRVTVEGVGAEEVAVYSQAQKGASLGQRRPALLPKE